MRDNTLEVKNAVIKSAEITNEDHGLLSVWLHLDYGGSGQGFGGYALYGSAEHWKKPSFNFAGHFLWRVLQIADVGRWSRLEGKTIRVKANWGHVQAIGHILKDDWFNPAEDFKPYASN